MHTACHHFGRHLQFWRGTALQLLICLLHCICLPIYLQGLHVNMHQRFVLKSRLWRVSSSCSLTAHGLHLESDLLRKRQRIQITHRADAGFAVEDGFGSLDSVSMRLNHLRTRTYLSHLVLSHAFETLHLPEPYRLSPAEQPDDATREQVPLASPTSMDVTLW